MSIKDIVLIHGLDRTSQTLRILQWLLKRRGYNVHYFTYRSLRDSIDTVPGLLANFLKDRNLNISKTAFIGHSFGGIVAHRFFLTNSEKPGKLIYIGTPFQGSKMARYVAKTKWLSWIAGKCLYDLADYRIDPSLAREAPALIAGTSYIWNPALKSPHDGLVEVAETLHPSATDKLLVPYNHMALVCSPRIADHIDSYIKTGCFNESCQDL